MQELELLNNKLDLLLKKYTALQAENRGLKETASQQLQTIESLNTRVVSLEQNMMASELGKSVMNDKDKELMRKQLDTVISEIDKILVTLND